MQALALLGGNHASASVPRFSSTVPRRHLKQARETTTENRRQAIGSHNGHDVATLDAHATNDSSSIIDCNSSSPLIYKPQCPETLTIARLAGTITCEGATDSWFGEIPARYGHANCFDSAVQALLLASEYRRGLWDVTRVLKVISEALNSLRLSLWVRKICTDVVVDRSC